MYNYNAKQDKRVNVSVQIPRFILFTLSRYSLVHSTVMHYIGNEWTSERFQKEQQSQKQGLIPVLDLTLTLTPSIQN